MNLSYSKLPVIVYIDASNIRNALKVFNIDLDFERLFKYFYQKYPTLLHIKYFEGNLRDNLYSDYAYVKAYTIRRKHYPVKNTPKQFRCSKCSALNFIRTGTKKFVGKSNIDVYMCSEMYKDFLKLKGKFTLIILTCDGDFKEAIEGLFELQPNLQIRLLTTPHNRKNNYLSPRLLELLEYPGFGMYNILSIKEYIK